MPVSAGTGQFLDNDSYEEVEVGPEVPETADFGVRISGDSMMPRYLDKQIVWIQKTDELNDGEIGSSSTTETPTVRSFYAIKKERTSFH